MLKKVLLSTAAVLLAAALPAGAGVSIDRVSPSTGGGCGANPAQILNLVPPGGGCDVAGVGPVLEVMPPAFGLVANDNIDGLSSNTFTPETINYYLIFSGSRVSVGAAGTPYNAEAAANQAAADLWRTQITSGSPAAAMAACAAVVVPTPPHAQHRNQTAFNLVRTAAPGIAVANPIDNIDAVELDVLDFTGDDIHDVDVYFSLDPASPNLVASGADIYFSPAGAGGFAVFSFPAQIGLMAGDNLDSLVMWDRGALGAANPGMDFALFSLSPGSPTLAMIGASPADIFVTDFAGGFCPFTVAAGLGLLVGDNVDGLDVIP